MSTASLGLFVNPIVVCVPQMMLAELVNIVIPGEHVNPDRLALVIKTAQPMKYVIPPTLVAVYAFLAANVVAASIATLIISVILPPIPANLAVEIRAIANLDISALMMGCALMEAKETIVGAVLFVPTQTPPIVTTERYALPTVNASNIHPSTHFVKAALTQVLWHAQPVCSACSTMLLKEQAIVQLCVKPTSTVLTDMAGTEVVAVSKWSQMGAPVPTIVIAVANVNV